MEASIAFDSTKYINSAIDEVVQTLLETVLIVIVVIFLFLGSLRTVLVPLVAIPVSLIGAVFLMQAFGFTLNLLTLLAIVLSVGLVVDDAIVVVENVERHIRRGQDAARGGARRRARAGRPDHRDDHHARRGLRADRLPGRAHRRALPRVRLHARGRGVHLRRRRAHALADDVVAAARRGARSHGFFARLVERAFDCVQRTLRSARSTATLRTRGRRLRGVDRPHAAHRADVHVLAQRARAQRGPGRRLRRDRRAAQRDARAAHAVRRSRSTSTSRRRPSSITASSSRSPRGGFGGMLVKPWEERKRTHLPDPGGADAASSRASPACARRRSCRSALPSAGTFPVEFVIASTASHEELLRFAEQLVARGGQERQFAFPPITDVRIDQAKSEIVIDRDKVASMGLNLQQVGADLVVDAGRQLRQSLQHRRPQLQGHPADRARRPPHGRPAERHPRHRARTGSSCRSAPSPRMRQGVEPRTLNRFQQLNAIKISGLAPRRLDAGLRVLEDAAAKILPPGYRVDYTGESRQLRQESGKFLPAMGLALVLIFLVLAAQFNSFRDPFVILAGSVPLAMFGAMIFTFLKFAGPPGMHFKLTEGWTTTLNIYSQVGLVTLVGLVVEERHPDRRVRQRPAGAGHEQDRRGARGGDDAPPADPDDHRGDRGRSLSAHAGHRARAPSRVTRSASCWSAG